MFTPARQLVLAMVGLLAALALLAAEASAAVFCVNKPDCEGTAKATIKAALDEAAQNGNDGVDTVYIGANNGVPYNEAISYADSETVHIIGDGQGETIVDASSGSVTATLLSPFSKIESMTLRVPDVSNGLGLRWDATAVDVQVIHTGSTATSTLGLRAEGNAFLEKSAVSIQGFGMFETVNGGHISIEDSYLFGGGRGINVGDDSLSIERSTVVARRGAVFVGGGGEVDVVNSVLRMTGSEATDATVTVASGADVTLRHATLVGSGHGRGLTVSADSAPAKARVFDSIIHDYQRGILCAGEAPHAATLDAGYSDVTDGVDVSDAECDQTFAGGMLNVDPQFVNRNTLLPILRLKGSSPLIDAGNPVNALTIDLARAPRKVDGDGDGVVRADMGAYEYQRQAPKPKLTAAPLTALTGQAIEFSGKGSSDPDPGDILTYLWDFGDGSTAAGQTVQHAYATGGAKTVTLTVTDSAGVKAATTAVVQITASPLPPKGPETGPPPASLSRLRAVPKRLKPASGAPKLVPGGRKGLLFTLTAPSEVILELARCKGEKGCARSRKVPGEVRFAAPAGESAIRITGRFKGRKLSPGRYLAKLSVPSGQSLSTRFDLR